MIYIYSSHLGGIYSTSYEQDYDDLYCSTCGDSDMEVGSAETLDELIDLLCYCQDEYYYNVDYIAEKLVEYSDGKLELPDDSWKERSYSASCINDADSYYSCDEFGQRCSCYQPDSDGPKTWCEECGHNFAAALRDVNSKEVLHTTLD